MQLKANDTITLDDTAFTSCIDIACESLFHCLINVQLVGRLCGSLLCLLSGIRAREIARLKSNKFGTVAE